MTAKTSTTTLKITMFTPLAPLPTSGANAAPLTKPVSCCHALTRH